MGYWGQKDQFQQEILDQDQEVGPTVKGDFFSSHFTYKIIDVIESQLLLYS